MSKKDFSVALKYVEARPRSQRRKGAETRVSGISVVGSGASATDLSLLQANLISVTNNFTALKDLFDSMFEKDSGGNIHAKLSLWSSGGITAGGVGSGGSGGGGISYNRLDSWSDYSADKSGWVLSALLGKDLDNRVSALANAGYITASALAPYALRSEIPSLEGYATLDALNTLSQTVVNFKSLFDSMFEKDSDGNIHAKLSLWSSGGITAGGVGSGGSGGGGISYNRLDSWSDYSADKSGWVLSALLGKDLDNRVSALANAGYITASYLAPYALRSEIPSLVGYATESFVTSQGYITASALAPYALRSEIPSLTGYATQSWVLSQQYLTSISRSMVTDALGVTLGYARGRNSIPLIELSGVMEIGKYIDFHTLDEGDGVDYSLRIECQGAYRNRVYFPTTTGTLALTSNLPTKLSQLTDDVVAGKYLSLSGGVITGQGDTRYVQLRLSGDIATIGFQQYGVDKGVVGWLGNTGIRLQNLNGYGLAVTDSNEPIYYWGENGSVQRTLLHSGNYSSYALPITGGTVNGILSVASVLRMSDVDGIYKVILQRDSSGNILFGGGFAANNMYIDADVLRIRANETKFSQKVTAPSFIGNLTGNADSATKLQTPRTIWGQSFDGTGNISGNLNFRNGSSITCANGIVLEMYAGVDTYLRGSSNIYISAPNVYTQRNVYTYKVLDSGNYSSYALPITGGTVNGSITANSLTIGGVTLTYDSANEALCINGNMYALGGITAGGAGISAYTSLEARVARLEQQLNIP